MKREKILVNCIDDIQTGKRSLEECITKYPELADELRSIVRIMGAINSQAVTPSPEFRQRVRNRLQSVIASTGTERRHAGTGFRLFAGRGLGYALTVFSLLFAVGGGSVVYASQYSLPSDTLYPVKTGVEKLQLALSLSPESKSDLHLKLADRRIEEVKRESARGRDISASALEAAASQIDDAIKDMNEISSGDTATLLSRLSESTLNQQATLEQVSKDADEKDQPAIQQAIDATRRGNMIAQVADGNPSFLDTGASVQDEELDSNYFEIEGTVLSVEGQTWNIGGIELHNVKAPRSIPGVGSSVKLHGMLRGDETYIGKIEKKDDTRGETRFEGIYRGTNADGVWNVSGILAGKSDNVTPPPPGSEVTLKGTLRNGVFIIEQSESSKDRDSEKEDTKDKPNQGETENSQRESPDKPRRD